MTDPHGNVVQLTDEAGKVIKTYEYDSFGNEVEPDSKDENPFRYCGEYYDKETEEIYLRARYYQPAVGRFLTRDSYTGESEDPMRLHLYTYCENDGVNAWDPSGHKIYATEENIAGFSFYLDKYVQSTKNKSAIGKKKRNIEDIVTVKKLRKIGWKEQNIQYTKLVKALKKYKMKNKDSMAFFIATCSAETDCGNIMLEHGSEKYFEERGYTRETRGAGYIQVTGDGNKDLAAVRKGKKFEYEKKSDIIKIGKNTYTAPSHWEKRKRYYKKAIKHIG